jgi:hypothetical protein
VEWAVSMGWSRDLGAVAVDEVGVVDEAEE